jgi:hypothetical protein
LPVTRRTPSLWNRWWYCNIWWMSKKILLGYLIRLIIFSKISGEVFYHIKVVQKISGRVSYWPHMYNTLSLVIFRNPLQEFQTVAVRTANTNIPMHINHDYWDGYVDIGSSRSSKWSSMNVVQNFICLLYAIFVFLLTPLYGLSVRIINWSIFLFSLLNSIQTKN